MKLHRFYVNPLTISSTQEATLSSPWVFNQIVNVLRCKVAHTIVIIDGSGFEYLCEIKAFSKKSVIVSIVKKLENKVKSERETWLFASLVKKDNFEWIAEKATELGVSHIIPILAHRSEKKDINKERLQKIVIEASEQSGRATIPEIGMITIVSDALKLVKEKGMTPIVFHTEGEKFKKEMITIVSTPIAVFIGPEGGWSEEELELFKKAGISILNLGPQILRSETAVIAALAQIVF